MNDTIETPMGPIELGVHRDHSMRYPWEVAAYAVDLAQQMQEKGTLPEHTKPIELDETDREILGIAYRADLEEFQKAHEDCDGLMWINELQEAAENVINALLPEGYYAGNDGDAGGWGFWKTEEDED